MLGITDLNNKSASIIISKEIRYLIRHVSDKKKAIDLSADFLDITPCTSEITDVSEEYIVSIFSVE
jgi:hypothetical protein